MASAPPAPFGYPLETRAARSLAAGLLAAALVVPGCGAEAPRSAASAADAHAEKVARATPAPEPPGPPGMVFVAPGSFHRGCSPHDPDCFKIETPAGPIHLDGYFIDRTEVTVAQYRKCVEAGACSIEGITLHTPETTTSDGWGAKTNSTTFGTPYESDTCNYGATPPERDDHPINCVSWDEAHAYCAWAGKRLPSEAEWAKGARGASSGLYPWGDDKPTCALAVIEEHGAGCRSGHTSPVGSRPSAGLPYGLADMIGNVMEWVEDWYAPDYYASSPTENPRGPTNGRYRMSRGGSFKTEVKKGGALRISNRYAYIPSAHLDHLGFRCAADAPASTP